MLFAMLVPHSPQFAKNAWTSLMGIYSHPQMMYLTVETVRPRGKAVEVSGFVLRERLPASPRPCPACT